MYTVDNESRVNNNVITGQFSLIVLSNCIQSCFVHSLQRPETSAIDSDWSVLEVIAEREVIKRSDPIL